MTTCEICNRTLDEDDLKTPVRWEDSDHYVCCYTCETVLCDIDMRDRRRTIPQTVS